MTLVRGTRNSSSLIKPGLIIYEFLTLAAV